MSKSNSSHLLTSLFFTAYEMNCDLIYSLSMEKSSAFTSTVWSLDTDMTNIAALELYIAPGLLASWPLVSIYLTPVWRPIYSHSSTFYKPQNFYWQSSRCRIWHRRIWLPLDRKCVLQIGMEIFNWVRKMRFAVFGETHMWTFFSWVTSAIIQASGRIHQVI